ncbi:S1 family peptidase [Amycolatopsis dendrobii]|uniref:Trypsin-like serine protease n=1 Tax=Amycolatopsis dendrobii TaxID=2760662 RepID=A0A7W3VXV5_9PSEU|nr:trypsin-like serine protease [Amycolatopsis dendrobii]MBB1154702.1 trypsin-like serine protease [Amycolatopsis dendrobii]
MLRRSRRRLAVLAPVSALVAVAVATPASAVIGGSVSGYGPWAVRMLVDGKPECTGTAISREWIISADHCFHEAAEPIADSRIEFRVGNLDQRLGTVVRPVPGSRDNHTLADIMLIKVAPMDLTPAKLPTGGPVRPGETVRQLGWGATCTGDENSCQSDVLKQVDAKVIDPDDPRCDGMTVSGGTDFCALTTTGVTAGGDSGGPVMSTADRDTLVGVTSKSDRSSLAADGDVFGQLEWIKKTIKG